MRGPLQYPLEVPLSPSSQPTSCLSSQLTLAQDWRESRRGEKVNSSICHTPGAGWSLPGS